MPVSFGKNRKLTFIGNDYKDIEYEISCGCRHFLVSVGYTALQKMSQNPVVLYFNIYVCAALGIALSASEFLTQMLNMGI